MGLPCITRSLALYAAGKRYIFSFFVVQQLQTSLDIVALHWITNTRNIADVPLYRPLGGDTAIHLKTAGQFPPSSFFFNRWIAPLDLPISSAQSRML